MSAKKKQENAVNTIVQPRSLDDRLESAKAYLRHVDAQNRRSKKGEFKIGFAKDLLTTTVKIPTGITSMDLLLNGGIPLGKCIVVYGTKGVTKTNFIYEVIKSCIKYGYLCSRFDVEQQDDDKWLKNIDLDTSKMLVSDEVLFPVVWDSIFDQIDRDAADIFIVDSLDALLHSAVEKGDVDSDHMALTARKMSQIVFPKLLGRLSKTNKTCIIVCQARSDIGPGGAGDLANYSGGNALKHDSSLDIWFRRQGVSSLRGKGERFKSGDTKIGFAATAKITKSKLWGVRETSALSYEFFYDRGIDMTATLFETSWKLGMLTLSGAQYKISDQGKKEIVSGAGYTDTLNKIRDNKDIQEKIRGAMEDIVHKVNPEAISESDTEIQEEQNEKPEAGRESTENSAN